MQVLFRKIVKKSKELRVRLITGRRVADDTSWPQLFYWNACADSQSAHTWISIFSTIAGCFCKLRMQVLFMTFQSKYTQIDAVRDQVKTLASKMHMSETEVILTALAMLERDLEPAYVPDDGPPTDCQANRGLSQGRCEVFPKRQVAAQGNIVFLTMIRASHAAM